MTSSLDAYALVVVDAQAGFDDLRWGRRNNPACDTNIERLVLEWSARRRPLVYVRHDSDEPDSPLRPDSPGNRLKPYLSPEADLLVTKRVNSAFHGTPDLHGWLTAAGVDGIVVCGITTNHCCETTARVGGNLGHHVLFVLDATHTFDRQGPDGSTWSADQLARATAVNLHGEFADVVTTDQLVASEPT
ncbi:isochorismatase family protein [Nocardioides sp. MAH-18]|uniref:Isochorismatase family protein n=1 Tax=Nocardioides agri TaxID=2682843 RepID=A0A6L6XUC2_9ACTN|nr:MULTISPECIES: cysteine hydrolase family protein [unclassified Nocardioides]MBA2956169.1 cysteine hydrolase [Nocardioides sp. CGMCC 1.13656]MVQ51014.1 isochorismatase family protein [Nocardioides sp. MAH-18]